MSKKVQLFVLEKSPQQPNDLNVAKQKALELARKMEVGDSFNALKSQTQTIVKYLQREVPKVKLRVSKFTEDGTLYCRLTRKP